MARYNIGRPRRPSHSTKNPSRISQNSQLPIGAFLLVFCGPMSAAPPIENNPNKTAHFLSTKDLSGQEIKRLLKIAGAFAPYVKRNENVPILKDKTIVNLFLENSTRTRVSFELAARKLSASVLNFAASSSSLDKGESLTDTALNIQAMGPHCMVVRHASAGSPYRLSKILKIPVINAGDGFHEHPTQALLDIYTIEEKLTSLKDKNVVIIGDIAHSRVARSNIFAMKTLGAKVSVCGPPTLLPPDPSSLGVNYAYRPEALLPQADVVMMLRIQMERHKQRQFPSLSEYSRFWGLNKTRAQLLKPSALILHPGPINRGVEIDPEVADGANSVILNQVFNGILIRMAILADTCHHEGLSEWMAKNAGKYPDSRGGGA